MKCKKYYRDMEKFNAYKKRSDPDTGKRLDFMVSERSIADTQKMKRKSY